jgi:hypothetical protein
MELYEEQKGLIVAAKMVVTRSGNRRQIALTVPFHEYALARICVIVTYWQKPGKNNQRGGHDAEAI